MYLEKYIAKKESSFSLETSIDISEYEIYLSFSGLSKLFILRDNCFNPMECLSSMSYAQPTNKPEVNTDTRKCRAILSSNETPTMLFIVGTTVRYYVYIIEHVECNNG